MVLVVQERTNELKKHFTIEDDVYLFENYTELTISEFQNKLNIRKQLIRERIKKYEMRKGNGIGRLELSYKLLLEHGNQRKNINLISELLGISRQSVKKYYNIFNNLR